MSQPMLLAAEGSSGVGGQIAVAILLIALAAFAAAYFVVGPGRRRGPRTRGDIPLAMRPYHSDEELETTGMERAMAWGVALAAFLALFLPLYWVIEPTRIQDKRDEFYLEDVAHGGALYQANCATCHGSELKGGAAPHPDPEVDAPWPAPALDNIVARYEDSVVIGQMEMAEFLYRTIAQGRPGTPMPAWGAAYAGPLNDQQIEQIATYILSVQTGEVGEAQAYVGASGADIFQENCARCHGPRGEGYVGPSLQDTFARFGAQPGDEASIEQAIAAVRSTIVRGRGVPTGAIMPPHEDKLTDGAIDRLIDYLLTIQQRPLR